MLLKLQEMARFDAVLLYDMPSMDFGEAVDDRPGLSSAEAPAAGQCIATALLVRNTGVGSGAAAGQAGHIRG
ncbi:hypothetical protein V474_13945 [Novosphingobium barchaimii LL02]|uniref:Uncharacterized protein n=1 Tax=Novosphingobium barchaimii LL02 TaxID=1114963 RepID=A0A0J7XY73_9SPHN|nr:hypothetical protein [Novosphingobium barchaimii]KMS56616.1 hypothetical protein V474_13945 [Novosphingobium barchaimii LL02]